MKIDDLKELHNHMINKFNSLNKISEIEEFPISCIENQTKKTISLHDNLYKIRCISITVNIEKIFTKEKKYSQQEKILIISEINYCISKIMNIYNAKNINFSNMLINGNFQIDKRTDFNILFECCAVINTFKLHLNKMIKKYLIKNDYDYDQHYLEFGIGMWFGLNNYIYEIQNIKNREICVIGESTIYSNYLTEKSLSINQNILFNELVYQNMTDDYLKTVNDLIETTNLNTIKEQKIYSTNAVYVKYSNWIKNNIDN